MNSKVNVFDLIGGTAGHTVTTVWGFGMYGGTAEKTSSWELIPCPKCGAQTIEKRASYFSPKEVDDAMEMHCQHCGHMDGYRHYDQNEDYAIEMANHEWASRDSDPLDSMCFECQQEYTNGTMLCASCEIKNYGIEAYKRMEEERNFIPPPYVEV